MDVSQLTTGVHETDLIGERHHRMSTGSPTSPVKEVIGRLLVWFGLTLLAFVMFVHAVASVFTLGYSSGPPPEADRVPLIAMPVLFALSLVPVLGPGARRGLRVFGVVWAIPTSLLVMGTILELV